MEYLLTAGIAICTVMAAAGMALWLASIAAMIINDLFKED